MAVHPPYVTLLLNSKASPVPPVHVLSTLGKFKPYVISDYVWTIILPRPKKEK